MSTCATCGSECGAEGHICPMLIKRLDDKEKDILSNPYSDQKKVRSSLEQLSYANIWSHAARHDTGRHGSRSELKQQQSKLTQKEKK